MTDHASKQASSTYYLMKDRLGSIINILDENETLKTTYSYDAFGEPTATYHSGQVDCTYRFAGREYDGGMGNYFYRARYYNQSLGRFFSRDPIMSLGSLYAYCNNSPANFTDPTGLACTDEKSYGDCITCCEAKRMLAEVNAYMKWLALQLLASQWDEMAMIAAAGCAAAGARVAVIMGEAAVAGGLLASCGNFLFGFSGYYLRQAQKIRAQADRMYRAAMNQAATKEEQCKAGCNSTWPGSGGTTAASVTFEMHDVPAP